MKNVAGRVVVMIGAVVVSVGCGEPSPSIADTGIGAGDDAGLADGGAPASDAAPTDAGPASTDGSVAGACTLESTATSIGSLSAGCAERCSVETRTAVSACGADLMCSYVRLLEDETRGVEWSVDGVAMDRRLDCFVCVYVQQIHCFAEVCPEEAASVLERCIVSPSESACIAAETAVNTCLMGAESTVPVQACMAGASGVALCFPR